MGEVCSEIGDGLHSAPEYDDNGKFYFINGNNLINGHIVINSKETKRVSEKTFEKNNKQLDDNTVLLSINGTIGNLAYYQGEPVMLGKSAAYLKANKIDKTFLYSLLQTTAVMNNFMLSLTGTTIKNLGLDAIKNTKISIPELHEQKKIGLYFSQLDNLITLHQRKCEEMKILKKYMLQKMFPQNGQKVPEIRFKGFTEDWEQRKLNEIADKVSEKNKNNEFSEPFTNSAEQGIISQKDYFDREIVNNENLNGYYIVRNDDFIYNPRISVTAPVGPINRNRLGRNGVMSPLYTVFRTHDIDNLYLEFYFKTTKWHRFMKLNGDSGARFDRFTISSTQFMEMPIPYPTLEEQQKIGEYFDSLDNLITLHQRKYEELKNIKKFMLQNMFV